MKIQNTFDVINVQLYSLVRETLIVRVAIIYI